MKERLSIFDNHQVQTEAARRRLASFILLGSYLADGGQRKRGRDPYETLWRAASRRPAGAFVDRGTAFFWKNVGLCIAECQRLGGAATDTLDSFAVSGFDSFFDWLEDGSTVVTAGGGAGRCVVMPRLGVRVPAETGPVTLKRYAEGAVEVAVPGKKLRLNLADLDPAYRLPAVSIPGQEATLLLVKDPALFEEQYIERITEMSDQGPVLARVIGKAVEMIDAVDPSLGLRYRQLIRWYVPLSSPGTHTHNSMSVKGLQGIIFLSEAYNDIRLAEALVHEFYHNELYRFQEGHDTHVSAREEELYYSPWRPDARPLDGLFHALYVFSGVAEFIRRAEALPELSDYREPLRNRRTQVVAQLRLGLWQLRMDRLTPEGKALMQIVEREVVDQESQLGALEGLLQPALADHLSTWQATHPQLASRVRLPAQVAIP